MKTSPWLFAYISMGCPERPYPSNGSFIGKNDCARTQQVNAVIFFEVANLALESFRETDIITIHSGMIFLYFHFYLYHVIF